MSGMSDWVAGVFFAACALLAWSGIAKLRRPGATQLAARAIGLPASRRAVRTFGTAELAVASVGAVFGGVGALFVALCFGALALVAFRLVRRAPATPCGCLGASDAPASIAHVVVNTVAALAGFAMFVAGGSPLTVLTDQPLAAAPFVVLVVCAARLAALLIEPPATKGVRV
jgi:hypothetical protein